MRSRLQCWWKGVEISLWNAGGEGEIDKYEEDAINYTEGEEYEICDECNGKGGWNVCPECADVEW